MQPQVLELVGELGSLLLMVVATHQLLLKEFHQMDLLQELHAIG